MAWKHGISTCVWLYFILFVCASVWEREFAVIVCAGCEIRFWYAARHVIHGNRQFSVWWIKPLNMPFIQLLYKCIVVLTLSIHLRQSRDISSKWANNIIATSIMSFYLTYIVYVRYVRMHGIRYFCRVRDVMLYRRNDNAVSVVCT